MAKFCSNCGMPLNEGDIFCASCGTKSDSNETIVNNTGLIQNSNHKTKNKLFLPLVLLAVIAIIAYFIFYNNQSTPEKTIKNFEKSYNELDTDGMLECLEPDAQSVFKGTMALLSGLSGYDAETIFESVLGYVDITNSESQPQVKLKVTNINYKTKTNADVTVDYSFFDGESNEESTGTFPMVKYDGKWYISVSDSTFNDTSEEESTDYDTTYEDASTDTSEDNADMSEDNVDTSEEDFDVSEDYSDDSDTSYTDTEDDVSEKTIASETIDNSIIQSVEASSVLAAQSDSNYVVENAIDGNSNTAWVEGVDGNGKGEWIQLNFDGIHSLSGMDINNGYKKSEYVYKINNRPHKIRISFSDGTYEDFTLLDNFDEISKIDFSKSHETQYIKLQILSVYKGTKYQDTCITDLKIY